MPLGCPSYQTSNNSVVSPMNRDPMEHHHYLHWAQEQVLELTTHLEGPPSSIQTQEVYLECPILWLLPRRKVMHGRFQLRQTLKIGEHRAVEAQVLSDRFRLARTASPHQSTVAFSLQILAYHLVRKDSTTARLPNFSSMNSALTLIQKYPLLTIILCNIVMSQVSRAVNTRRHLEVGIIVELQNCASATKWLRGSGEVR